MAACHRRLCGTLVYFNRVVLRLIKCYSCGITLIAHNLQFLETKINVNNIYKHFAENTIFSLYKGQRVNATL